ncbi:MAG: radical SAM protein [Candidatus Wallbacteria bacterium]|nr:radical SAM protein [Candidatus Wallbacteria bacterium]
MKVLLLRVQGETARKSRHPRNIRPPYLLKYLQSLLTENQKIETIFSDEYLGDEPIVPAESSPEIVVLSIITSDAGRSLDIARIYKQNPATVIIVCGQDPSGRPGFYLHRDEVDYIALGESEQSLSSLISLLAAQRDFQVPDGVIDVNLGNTACQAIVDNPDDLPIPFYSERELEGYRFYYPVPVSARLRYGHILSSRGCPGGCLFCSQVFRESFGNNLRLHSPERVIAEIMKFKSLGVNFICFDDDNFGCDREWTRKFLDLMIQNGLDIHWQCHLRVENLDQELLKLYAAAGCRLLRLGVESGSKSVLRRIGKTMEPEKYLTKAAQVFSLTKKFGIQSLFLALIGNPDETFGDVLRTGRLIRRLKPDLLQVSFLTIYPSSALYRNYGHLSDHHSYHYSTPEHSPSRMSRRVLKFGQAYLYCSFYFNPFFLLKHFFSHFIFYLRNFRVFIKLLRSLLYLFEF